MMKSSCSGAIGATVSISLPSPSQSPLQRPFTITGRGQKNQHHSQSYGLHDPSSGFNSEIHMHLAYTPTPRGSVSIFRQYRPAATRSKPSSRVLAALPLTPPRMGLVQACSY